MAGVVQSGMKLALTSRLYTVPLAGTSKVLIGKRKPLPGTGLDSVKYIPYLSPIMTSPQDWQ